MRVATDQEGTMTPEEFTAKVEEMRTIVADKVAELEEDPKWGSEDEREQIVNTLEELLVQVEALSEALQEEVEEDEDGSVDK
jgi:hypothetical protein